MVVVIIQHYIQIIILRALKGKKFSFSAGSSNKVKVDLVHKKGTIVQTVVSSWTISAGGSKSHTITD